MNYWKSSIVSTSRIFFWFFMNLLHFVKIIVFHLKSHLREMKISQGSRPGEYRALQIIVTFLEPTNCRTVSDVHSRTLVCYKFELFHFSEYMYWLLFLSLTVKMSIYSLMRGYEFHENDAFHEVRWILTCNFREGEKIFFSVVISTTTTFPLTLDQIY